MCWILYSDCLKKFFFQIKNSSSNKVLSYPRAAQCITLPSQCRNCEDLEISDIFPTYDYRHVLVVVKSLLTDTSFLIVYAIDLSDKMCKIVQEPLSIRQLQGNEKPVEIHLLPYMDKFPSTNRTLDPIGNAIIVSEDGAVRIVNLETLSVICYGKINEEKIISAVYCNSKFCFCVLMTVTQFLISLSIVYNIGVLRYRIICSIVKEIY